MGCIWTELNVKVIGLDTHIRKEERNQITDFTFKHKKWEEDQIKSQVSRRKKIINIKVEIRGIESVKTIEKVKWNQKLVLWENQ